MNGAQTTTTAALPPWEPGMRLGTRCCFYSIMLPRFKMEGLNQMTNSNFTQKHTYLCQEIHKCWNEMDWRNIFLLCCVQRFSKKTSPMTTRWTIYVGKWINIPGYFIRLFRPLTTMGYLWKKKYKYSTEHWCSARPFVCDIFKHIFTWLYCFFYLSFSYISPGNY